MTLLTDARAHLVARAAALVPMLRAGGGAAETARRLPPGVFDALSEADLLFFASGASAIQSHVPIQRFQRDMQALANHAIMHPQTTVEAVRARAVRARAEHAALLITDNRRARPSTQAQQPVVKVPAQHRGRRGAPLTRRDD
jgi:hypothetical protein